MILLIHLFLQQPCLWISIDAFTVATSPYITKQPSSAYSEFRESRDSKTYNVPDSDCFHIDYSLIISRSIARIYINRIFEPLRKHRARRSLSSRTIGRHESAGKGREGLSSNSRGSLSQ